MCDTEELTEELRGIVDAAINGLKLVGRVALVSIKPGWHPAIGNYVEGKIRPTEAELRTFRGGKVQLDDPHEAMMERLTNELTKQGLVPRGYNRYVCNVMLKCKNEKRKQP